MSNEQAVAQRLHLTVIGRLAGGEAGAYGVRTDKGAQAVLKVLATHPAGTLPHIQHGIALATRLRASGYPAPRYWDAGIVDGTVYTLQELVAGRVPDVLSVAHANRLVELWSAHAGAAPKTDAWARHLTTALERGTEALFVDHTVVRASHPHAAELVDEIVHETAGVDSAAFGTSDVVHGDFHHRNLLATGEHVTAVFDWEAARSGDARFDLAKLAFWTEVAAAGGQAEPAAAALVKQRAAESIPPDVRAPLAALIALQQLTFAARTRPQLLDWSLAAVDRSLRPLWQHTDG